MKAQACEPCAKRKVRCDKEEPCSNCKRRKHDHCTYPDVSPLDKIKRLETLVRSLGGDPDDEYQSNSHLKCNHTPSAKSQTHLTGSDHNGPSIDTRAKDAVVLEEDGKPFYLESRAWLSAGQSDNSSHDAAMKNPFLTRNSPNAFQGRLYVDNAIDLSARHPSQGEALVLWDAFDQRVSPLVRINFNWSLDHWRSVSTNQDRQRELSAAEQAFLFSFYLISVVSLSDEECQEQLQQSRSLLLSEYQMLCEEAFSRANIFCITDIMLLKALTIYMIAGIERLSIISLWSLMGLVIRNAEKLGVHRDGTLLGLSPCQTEERRRLWWQLQQLDLIMAVMSGLTPMTLMADWDAKLPLNIEDEDIDPDMVEFPTERKGLTTMSYCLYTFWVLNHQRRFFCQRKGPGELSWQSNKSLVTSVQDSAIEQLEEGLNQRFLQYCDPIKPVNTLIQISARSLICLFRLRSSHPHVYRSDGSDVDPKQREMVLTLSMQSLQYAVALHSQSAIRRFYWWTKSMFPWQAFMCVLVEASHHENESKIREIWDLLSDLYSANSILLLVSEDRRRSHAARLVVAAWKAREKKLEPNRHVVKPKFVTQLEERLSEHAPRTTTESGQETGVHQEARPPIEPWLSESFLANADTEQIFDLDFQNIDWSFWSSSLG